MKTGSPRHLSNNRDPKFDSSKRNPENYNISLTNALQIVGLEQVENDLPEEQYYHQLFEIDKLGYVFKKEEFFSDGPEYDRVCPLCGQFVLENSSYLVYSSKEFKRKFLSHYECLVARDSQRFKFIQIPDQINEAVLIQQSHSTIRKHSINISQSYYGTLTISHPISNAIYLQMDKKIHAWNSEELQWSFGSQQPLLYSPNYVCLPYTDFKFSLVIDYQKITKRYDFLVNLNRRESKKKNHISASTSSITLQMQIINSAQEKQAVVSQMNFIYPFTKNFIVIKFNQIKIKIPQQLQQIETCTSEKKLYSEPVTSTASFSSPIIQNHNDYIYTPNQDMNYYSRLIPQQVPMSEYMPIQHSPIHYAQPSLDVYYNDIEDLIHSGKIRQYVQTSNGSREFQKYLKKCSLQEVQQVLSSSYDDLAEFIVHDYANYMFQGLIHVCSPEQRLKILNKIAPSLSVLSQNKKGTHSLQTLITVITTGQQASVVCKALEKDLIILAEHSNATHLVQKVIQTFEAIYLTDFWNQFLREFVRLSKNAFGICVLKTFMKKVQNSDQMVNSIVDNISKNLDVIIQDPYGNYIVQHAYEMFGEDKCRKITDQIINKFTQYCIQKFSANVVQKCITTYCTSMHSQAIDSIMEASSLEQMLKTATGNSILLKLVRAYPDKQVEDKIRKILSLPRMSKYSNNWDSHFYNFSHKAATCKNIDGQTFNNFSQAAQMAKNGKTKKGSYTPKVRKF